MKKKNLFCMLFIAPLLFAMATARVGALETVVSVDPPTYTAPDIGTTFAINVTVTGVTDLYGWEIWLYYDTVLLDPYPDMNNCATEGPFLKQGGTTYWTFDYLKSTDSWNATHGRIHVGCLLLIGPQPGVDGSGVLATFNFNATAVGGPSPINIVGSELTDHFVEDIVHTTSDGEVTVIPEFPVALIVPLFMVITLVAVILGKKALSRKRGSPFRCQVEHGDHQPA